MIESDLAEELPLCCCRMETPYSGSRLSTLDQTCMAMESVDGVVKINSITYYYLELINISAYLSHLNVSARQTHLNITQR